MPTAHFRTLDFDWDSEPTPDDMVAAGRDIDLVKKIMERIRKTTSEHYWFRVEVTVRGGIAKIAHDLLPPQHGYVIHLSDLLTESGWKIIDHACGLLLEIFYLPRSRFNRDLYLERRKETRRERLGIPRREIDFTTGKSRIVLPDYYGAK